MKGILTKKGNNWYISCREWAKGLPKNKGDIFSVNLIDNSVTQYIWNGERSSEFYYKENSEGGVNIDCIVIPIDTEIIVEEGMEIEFNK